MAARGDVKVKKEIPIHYQGVHALTLTVEAVVTRPLRGDVNAEVTRLKDAKRYSDAVALLRDLVENKPDEAIPQDKARMADLMQQAGDYKAAVAVFESILEDAKQHPNELNCLVEVVIPTLRRWRSAAKRAGAQADVERCITLIAQADDRVPMARAKAEKARILKNLKALPYPFDHMGWSSASSIDEACTSLNLHAWQLPSQEFVELVERHFSSPPKECRCSCNPISSMDLERRPWKVTPTQSPMRY